VFYSSWDSTRIKITIYFRKTSDLALLIYGYR
jgi:hypothetical protein